MGTGCPWAVQSCTALELPRVSSTSGLLLRGHPCFRTLLLLSWEELQRQQLCSLSPGARTTSSLSGYPPAASCAQLRGCFDGWEWGCQSSGHTWHCSMLCPNSASLPFICSWLIFWRPGRSRDCRDESAAPVWLLQPDNHTQTHTHKPAHTGPSVACTDLLPCQDLTARPLVSL